MPAPELTAPAPAGMTARDRGDCLAWIARQVIAGDIGPGFGLLLARPFAGAAPWETVTAAWDEYLRAARLADDLMDGRKDYTASCPERTRVSRHEDAIDRACDDSAAALAALVRGETR